MRAIKRIHTDVTSEIFLDIEYFPLDIDSIKCSQITSVEEKRSFSRYKTILG